MPSNDGIAAVKFEEFASLLLMRTLEQLLRIKNYFIPVLTDTQKSNLRTDLVTSVHMMPPTTGSLWRRRQT